MSGGLAVLASHTTCLLKLLCSDAEIMRQKNEAAAKKKAEQEAAAHGGDKPKVVKQKVPMENPNKNTHRPEVQGERK